MGECILDISTSAVGAIKLYGIEALCVDGMVSPFLLLFMDANLPAINTSPSVTERKGD
jgi:hypothetical protein